MIEKGTDGCIIDSDVITEGSFTNELTLGKGLIAKTGEKCQTTMQAGVELTSNDGWPANDDATGDFTTLFTFGKNLRVDYSEPCSASIGAGVDVYCGSECVEGCSITGDLFHTITFGKGLNAEDDGDFKVKVGLDFQIDGNQVTNLSLGDCLKYEAGGTCAGTLSFADLGSTADTVSFCVPSGPSCAGGTVTLEFDACGRFISGGMS
jgi:hypothetical protein